MCLVFPLRRSVLFLYVGFPGHFSPIYIALSAVIPLFFLCKSINTLPLFCYCYAVWDSFALSAVEYNIMWTVWNLPNNIWKKKKRNKTRRSKRNLWAFPLLPVSKKSNVLRITIIAFEWNKMPAEIRLGDKTMPSSTERRENVRAQYVRAIYFVLCFT